MSSIRGKFPWLCLLGALSAHAAPRGGKIPVAKHFQKIMIVMFENTAGDNAIKQPFFAELARKGVWLSNYAGVTHPSQGNYIALTAGDLLGVKGDANYDLDIKHLGDLLEAKGFSWKTYVEGYPGNCFRGGSSGNYARKHNPFISFVNVQKNPARCARIVNASELDRDIQNGTLADYSLYVPDIKNDGHDTGVAYADRWFSKTFGPRLVDPRYAAGMLTVATFDENDGTQGNRIYTSFTGTMVVPGNFSAAVNHYSLIRMIEDNYELGNLGRKDATAPVIGNVWRQ